MKMEETQEFTGLPVWVHEMAEQHGYRMSRPLDFAQGSLIELWPGEQLRPIWLLPPEPDPTGMESPEAWRA